MHIWDKQCTREQGFATITAALKKPAKELQLPIIGVHSSIGRSNQDKTTPLLSDIRASGTSKQEADIIGFLSRADDYGVKTDSKTGKSNEGLAKLTIAKNRNGPTCEVPLFFEKALNKFIEHPIFGKDPAMLFKQQLKFWAKPGKIGNPNCFIKLIGLSLGNEIMRNFLIYPSPKMPIEKKATSS